jgi:hypothetical protein
LVGKQGGIMSKNVWIKKRKIREKFGDINTSAEHAFWQLSELNFDRFNEKSFELEQEIAKSAHFSYVFACEINERFGYGEIAISKSAKYSLMYAKNVLNDRFERGEETILKDKKMAFKYCSFLQNICIDPPSNIKNASKEYLENSKFSFFNKEVYSIYEF